MQSLSSEIGKFLSESNLTLSVAESCSAGGISSEICRIPGSSVYFLGGIVSYSNKSKIRDLGVSEIDINKFTEVSEIVVSQMSLGVAEKFNSDFSVSTTGYAGPTGKDVGKVFISINTPKNNSVKQFHFQGDREEITTQIIDKSLEFLLSEIKFYIFGDK